MNGPFRHFVSLAILLVALTTPGCLEELTGTDEEGESLVVTLANDSPDPVHLLAPGQQASASNRVSPGASRQVRLSGLSEGSNVRFTAVRNGRVVAETTCRPGIPIEELNPNGPAVIFIDIGFMECFNWGLR